MSIEIFKKILNLEYTERIGRTEYCDHPSLIKHITGLDPKNPEQVQKAYEKFYEWVPYDFLWSTNDGPVQWSELGRTTDMGHAIYQEDGSDYRKPKPCPFKSVEEVLNFDAVKEYGNFDIDERAEYFKKSLENTQNKFSDTLVAAGYYKTIVSGCIEAFGWEMFLEAVGSDPERFGDYVLEGFFNLTLANFQAWAKAKPVFFICHDDMVWTNGAIFNPTWYRRYIFPRYKKLWAVFKQQGIKILFCSDGNYTEFVDDIAQAGADGFIFEPLTDLEAIVKKYGKTHVIVGNADCRILTYGTKQDIEKEVLRCINTAKDCPGFVMAVGNHIPPNVPIDNAMFYFDIVKKYGKR
ncbi:MAG: uroporphyrinogen decarboxylase family protein [Candidatus Omnitrophica bacterium]|nr:uroporphyrinogen decarboxylase family protein [Candidatus Omnitrophota bacterium]